MRIAAALIASFALVAGLGAFLFFTGSTATDADFPPLQLGVEASIEPAGDGTYVCVATVTDLAKGKVIAGPTLKFRSGDEAMVLVTTDDGDRQLKIQVLTNDAESSARFLLSVVRDGLEQTVVRLNLRLEQDTRPAPLEAAGG